MLGALFGVVMNELLPEAFICVILILVLYDSAQKTYSKFKDMRANEEKEASLLNERELLSVKCTEKTEKGEPSLNLNPIIPVKKLFIAVGLLCFCLFCALA